MVNSMLTAAAEVPARAPWKALPETATDGMRKHVLTVNKAGT
jgi:hypothetical protein